MYNVECQHPSDEILQTAFSRVKQAFENPKYSDVLDTNAAAISGKCFEKMITEPGPTNTYLAQMLGVLHAYEEVILNRSLVDGYQLERFFNTLGIANLMAVDRGLLQFNNDVERQQFQSTQIGKAGRYIFVFKADHSGEEEFRLREALLSELANKAWNIE